MADMSNDKKPCPERRKTTIRERLSMIIGIGTMLTIGITIFLFLQTQSNYSVIQERRFVMVEQDIKNNKTVADLQLEYLARLYEEQKKAYEKLAEKVDTLISITRRMQ